MRDTRKIIRVERILRELEKEYEMHQEALSEIRIQGMRGIIKFERRMCEKYGWPRRPLDPFEREIMRGYMAEEEMDGDPDYDPTVCEEVRMKLHRIREKVERELDEEEGEGG